MIEALTADRPSFKTLEFRPGLNVLLADKRSDATEKDSRNGVGKTSFVELVHFLTGSRPSPKGILRSAPLREWRFELRFRQQGEPATVARSGKRANTVEVAGAAVPKGHDGGTLFGAGNHTAAISVDQWRARLGARWFGLDRPDDEDDAFRPHFRPLFSYFARREEERGFHDPMQYGRKQQTWDRQVSVSFLLGLDWRVARSFQRHRESQKVVQALRRGAAAGELSRFTGTAAELRTSLALARAGASDMKKRVEDFRVLKDYEHLEEEADDLTRQINELAGRSVADRQLLRELETSLTHDDDPAEEDIQRVYEEAGIVLPGVTLRRFEEVERFHARVVENRRRQLTAEIESARERLAERDREKESLDRRRRQVMGILKSGGALAEYTALREELGRREAEVETLGERLRDAERLESRQAELRVEKARLKRSLQDDISERDEILRDVILRFEDLSRSLYERAGSLTIGAGNAGPEFDVRIPAGRSRGIRNMQIFCFDLMLMDLLAERGRSPGFLIHDSHLFDGVDERQVARALQVGARRAEAGGFQYIVTLNTDKIPEDGFDPGFRLDDYFLDVRLTDDLPDGGLFGIRFD